jgi:AAA15 family ATPase/GTPase
MPTTVEETEKKESSEEKKDELLLDSLEIKGYRCFEHLTIEKLGRVNLIVGKNNVGKTALLEALWIYLNQGNSINFNQILNSRNENKLPVSFSGNGIIVHKHLFNRGSNELRFQIGYINEKSPLIAEWTTEHGIMAGRQTKGQIKNFFVKTDGLNNNEIIAFWDKIELTPKEEDVIQSMKFISPDLLQVRLRTVQNSERIPFAQVKNLEEPLTLKSFGEGLNRLFGISLALVNCKDGVLLIDEVEGGFHYSVLPDVWKLIFKTAKDLNVQVFATTHSKDCIEAFAQAAYDSPEDGMLVRLERQGENIVAKTIEEDMLVDAVNYEVEVR